MIKSAEAAAPAAVSSGAAIYAMDDRGAMRTLREGTNGYWCMPDDPVSPGIDPMCGDANAMEWLMAYGREKGAAGGQDRLLYMLAGGSDASNTDPFAWSPRPAMNGCRRRPHVMIVNAPEMMQGYPVDAKPDTTKPYVMYADTPYAHLMIPVE